MKRFIIILLSVLVLYAGVAWALEACLRHDGHFDHATPERRSDSSALVSHDDSRDPSVPIIHCTSATQEMGPMARVASVTISRSDKIIPLDTAFLHGARSALGSGLWLDALFKRATAFPSPINLARHLFLSVLQI